VVIRRPSDSSRENELRKGNSQEFPKKFEEKSFQFIQKRQILKGETLTRATRSDAERELRNLSLTPNGRKVNKHYIHTYIKRNMLRLLRDGVLGGRRCVGKVGGAKVFRKRLV